MPTWIKSSPQQSVAALNPTISTKAPNGLLMKGAIYEVGRVQGEYVSSFFAVPKSKRSPDKWRPILNLKKFNKYVCHVYFHMEELKAVRKWFQ